MLPPSPPAAVALAYMRPPFVIAWRGDRRAAKGRSPLAHPWIYALSLAVYCTAWTFYGSVGRAAVDGYGFLPIYLGPTLGAALGWVVYRKILRIAKAERLTSVADFLASRYGKSASLGAVVAVVAVVGAVPYIALQLKAVATSFRLLWNATHPEPLAFDAVSLVSAGLLAAFAILFGTRSLDLTEQHAGLVLAIAFESWSSWWRSSPSASSSFTACTMASSTSLRARRATLPCARSWLATPATGPGRG